MLKMLSEPAPNTVLDPMPNLFNFLANFTQTQTSKANSKSDDSQFYAKYFKRKILLQNLEYIAQQRPNRLQSFESLESLTLIFSLEAFEEDSPKIVKFFKKVLKPVFFKFLAMSRLEMAKKRGADQDFGTRGARFEDLGFRGTLEALWGLFSVFEGNTVREEVSVLVLNRVFDLVQKKQRILKRDTFWEELWRLQK